MSCYPDPKAIRQRKLPGAASHGLRVGSVFERVFKRTCLRGGSPHLFAQLERTNPMRKNSIHAKPRQYRQSWQLLLIFSMLLGPGLVDGQPTFGTITGTVTNSSKPVISVPTIPPAN